MRMAGPDILLFAIGVVLLAGAAFAIIQDGGLSPTSASGTFDVAFETSEATESATFATGDTTFTVDETATSKLTFTLACNDAGAGTPGAFNMQVTITGPGYEGDPEAATCGSSFEVDIAEPPSDTTVLGRDEDEARGNLADPEQAGLAVGEWTINVVGSRAGQLPVGLPAGEPTGSIDFTLESWRPVFTPGTR